MRRSVILACALQLAVMGCDGKDAAGQSPTEPQTESPAEAQTESPAEAQTENPAAEAQTESAASADNSPSAQAKSSADALESPWILPDNLAQIPLVPILTTKGEVLAATKELGIEVDDRGVVWPSTKTNVHQIAFKVDGTRVTAGFSQRVGQEPWVLRGLELVQGGVCETLESTHKEWIAREADERPTHQHMDWSMRTPLGVKRLNGQTLCKADKLTHEVEFSGFRDYFEPVTPETTLELHPHTREFGQVRYQVDAPTTWAHNGSPARPDEAWHRAHPKIYEKFAIQPILCRSDCESQKDDLFTKVIDPVESREIKSGTQPALGTRIEEGEFVTGFRTEIHWAEDASENQMGMLDGPILTRVGAIHHPPDKPWSSCIVSLGPAFTDDDKKRAYKACLDMKVEYLK